MRILIADDESSIRKGLGFALKSKGHKIIQVENGKRALERLVDDPVDLIITDVKMPEMTGLELLDALRGRGIKSAVIVMTAYANVQDAVTALKNGAKDYLIKPLNLDELTAKVKRIEEQAALAQENEQLRQKLQRYESPEIIGVSKAIRDVLRFLQRVAANAHVPVMIHGESGTGKELAARLVHGSSPRADRKFIAVNCAAFNDDLLESELFGYKKGAFTGAVYDKEGIFQTADLGTLFLDEVSEMSPRMQAKLLRALQEGTIQPVGATETIAVDVRIIGASNQDLQRLVRENKFRQDLYYRLNVVEVHLPPLRRRPEDIPVLLQHFNRLYRESPPLQFSSEVHQFFLTYSWPGNIRELENVVRMLAATHGEAPVRMSDLPPAMLDSKTQTTEPQFQTSDYRQAFEHAVSVFEEKFISFYLRQNNGNISKTAAEIGLSRPALYQKIKKYNLRL